MISIVVVSHSPALADAAIALALQMGGEHPPVVIAAAGTSDGSIGTDPVLIAGAIDRSATDEGVLVVTDLGSAVLSSEMAAEFTTTTAAVHLSSAPFVEGLVVAVAVASTGAGLEAVAAQAEAALMTKSPHHEQAGIGPARGSAHGEPSSDDARLVSREVRIHDAAGLHARPAAALVQLARSFDSEIRIGPSDGSHDPVDARSVIGLMSLGVVAGTDVRVSASGPDASAAVSAVVALLSTS